MATKSSAVADLPPPSVSVALTISPSTYKLEDGENGIPYLSITATLDPSAPNPVTVQTFSTIFYPLLALQRRNFTVRDISRNPATIINLETIRGPRRPGFQRRKGSRDEKYYVTLRPGHEVTVAQHPLGIVKWIKDDTHVFQAGHTYSFGVSDEGKEVQSWWWGTTDDVLDEVDGPPKDVSSIKGKGSILLITEPVYFDITE